MILFLTSSTESLLYPATATMSLLRVGDISIHLTTTRFDLTFPYIPYSFSTWFSSPMTCRAYELCISHASLDLLRSLNQDQSSGGFSSAMVDPDNKNKRTKTALLIMRISLMLITLAVTGAGAQRREPKAVRFWRPVDRLVNGRSPPWLSLTPRPHALSRTACTNSTDGERNQKAKATRPITV